MPPFYYKKMGTFHELAQRHGTFVKNLQSYIEGVVDDNQEILNLNRSQLKDEHSLIDDTPIRPQYSKNYAEFKGFKTPDLFLSGDLFRGLTIESKGNKYEIKGHTDYTPKLIKQYGKGIFGIAKSKQPAAKIITTKQLAKEYLKSVFQR